MKRSPRFYRSPRLRAGEGIGAAARAGARFDRFTLVVAPVAHEAPGVIAIVTLDGPATVGSNHDDLP